MGEVKSVLYKRKTELEQRIRYLEIEEGKWIRELKITRDGIRRRKKLLEEIMDVYNTLE